MEDPDLPAVRGDGGGAEVRERGDDEQCTCIRGDAAGRHRSFCPLGPIPEVPKPPAGWVAYGSLSEERYHLMRRRQAARWWDSKVGCWIGPEQRNVAPAMAWALAWEEAPEGLRAQVIGG